MSEIGRVNERRLNPSLFFVPEDGAIEEIALKLTDHLAFGFASYRVTVTDRLPEARTATSIDYLVLGVWSDDAGFTAHTIIKMELRPKQGAVDIDRMPVPTNADDIEHFVIVRAINERCQPPSTQRSLTSPFEDQWPV